MNVVNKAATTAPVYFYCPGTGNSTLTISLPVSTSTNSPLMFDYSA